MNIIKRTFYSDPGHAWLKVGYNELVELGIEADISPFSYRDGDDVYLEEDCDVGKYIVASNRNGIGINFDTARTNDESIIRSYDRYYFTTEGDYFTVKTDELLAGA